jgi:hypothetical protein
MAVSKQAGTPAKTTTPEGDGGPLPKGKGTPRKVSTPDGGDFDVEGTVTAKNGDEVPHMDPLRSEAVRKAASDPFAPPVSGPAQDIATAISPTIVDADPAVPVYDARLDFSDDPAVRARQENDPRRKAQIDGLLQEREGYSRRGLDERVGAVDTELRRLGYSREAAHSGPERAVPSGAEQR